MKKIKSKSIIWNVLLVVSVFLISANPSYALSFGDNLITNGNAEDGKGSPNGKVVKVKKWKVSGSFTTIQYGSDNYLTRTSPGPGPRPKARGKNFFAGGPTSAVSSARKTINVTSIGKNIDASGVLFKLSGFFGGFTFHNDNAVLSAEFINAAKKSISQVSIGSVLAADRGSVSGLLFRNLNGVIPPGTRKIRLVLTMVRAEGNYNDGYADNLSLVLKKASATAKAQALDDH